MAEAEPKVMAATCYLAGVRVTGTGACRLCRGYGYLLLFLLPLILLATGLIAWRHVLNPYVVFDFAGLQPKDTLSAGEYRAQGLWLATSAAWTVLWVCSVLASWAVIWRGYQETGRKLIPGILAVILGAALVANLMGLHSLSTSSPVIERMVQPLKMLVANPDGWLGGMTSYEVLWGSLRLAGLGSLIGIASLAYGVAAMTSYPKAEGELSLDSLTQRVRSLRNLLYLGAGFLVTGVLTVSAYMTWPAASFDKGSMATAQILDVATSTATYLGTIFTLMLLVGYVPAFMTLRLRAIAVLARDHDHAADEEMSLEEKVTKSGLDVSWISEIPKVLAIMGPVLTGSLGSLLGGLA